MKKILLMSLLCLAIVACGKKEEIKEETAEVVNTTQEQNYGIPNPYEIVDTLDEALLNADDISNLISNIK